jgi:hypothetical protein
MVGRSSDFGQTWSWVANPPQTSTFNTLDWIEGTEEVWASTLQTGLFQSTNGGLTWTRHDLGSSNVAEDLDFVDAGTGWCVGFGSSAGRIWRWYGATDVSLVPELPSFEIEARPNPFERDVFIGSQTPMIGPIEISIYDVLGRCLWSTEGVSPATGFRWDGHDYAGRSVSKGVYHYRFRAGSAEAFGRLIKVR